MLKVTNLELNASTAKVIAQRVMEDRGMRVATRFVPAESHYVVDINPSTRYRLNLSDENLVCMQESKVGNKYFITNLSEIKGSFNEVQERFFEIVKDLNKLLRK